MQKLLVDLCAVCALVALALVADVSALDEDDITPLMFDEYGEVRDDDWLRKISWDDEELVFVPLVYRPKETEVESVAI